MSQNTLIEWQQFLNQHPEAHLLQSGEWGQLKTQFGWSVERVLVGESGAQILFRPIVLGLASLAYIPKGPVGPVSKALWKNIERVCINRRALILKVEPDAWEDGNKLNLQSWGGFRKDGRAVQPRRSVLVDLHDNPDNWLARMKQKTRYNIRLAEKKGIEVVQSHDIELFHRQMVITGERDGFGVHTLAYYQLAYDFFNPKNQCVLLDAQYNGKSLAMIMVFSRGKRAWYFYGASTEEERNRMPTYLLQWSAMKWAASQGCTEYDLWGVPDVEEEELENQFAGRNDGLWGVYRFKRGFGGKVIRSVGAFEKAFFPGGLALYRRFEKGAGHRSD